MKEHETCNHDGFIYKVNTFEAHEKGNLQKKQLLCFVRFTPKYQIGTGKEVSAKQKTDFILLPLILFVIWIDCFFSSPSNDIRFSCIYFLIVQYGRPLRKQGKGKRRSRKRDFDFNQKQPVIPAKTHELISVKQSLPFEIINGHLINTNYY